MHVLGICFAGTATERRQSMSQFLEDVLGLDRTHVDGVEADLFTLPDNSTFAVADPRGMGDTERSIGFLVADLDEAIAELRRHGLEVGEPGGNERERYVHFTAPDGNLYELVQRHQA